VPHIKINSASQAALLVWRRIGAHAIYTNP